MKIYNYFKEIFPDIEYLLNFNNFNSIDEFKNYCDLCDDYDKIHVSFDMESSFCLRIVTFASSLTCIGYFNTEGIVMSLKYQRKNFLVGNDKTQNVVFQNGRYINVPAEYSKFTMDDYFQLSTIMEPDLIQGSLEAANTYHHILNLIKVNPNVL